MSLSWYFRWQMVHLRVFSKLADNGPLQIAKGFTNSISTLSTTFRLVPLHKSDVVHECLGVSFASQGWCLSGSKSRLQCDTHFIHPASYKDKQTKGRNKRSHVIWLTNHLLSSWISPFPGRYGVKHLLDDIPFTGRERNWAKIKRAPNWKMFCAGKVRPFLETIFDVCQ